MFAVSLHSACAMQELSPEVMNLFIAFLPAPHLPEGSFLHVLQEIWGSQGGAESFRRPSRQHRGGNNLKCSPSSSSGHHKHTAAGGKLPRRPGAARRQGNKELLELKMPAQEKKPIQ